MLQSVPIKLRNQASSSPDRANLIVVLILLATSGCVRAVREQVQPSTLSACLCPGLQDSVLHEFALHYKSTSALKLRPCKGAIISRAQLERKFHLVIDALMRELNAHGAMVTIDAVLDPVECLKCKPALSQRTFIQRVSGNCFHISLVPK